MKLDAQKNPLPKQFKLAGLAVQSDLAAMVDEELHAVTFTISTIEQDRSGDIMHPGGCRLDNYRKNPIVFFNHQTPPLPIGTAEHPLTKQLSVVIKEDRVLATCYFDMESEFAAEVYRLVKKRLLRACSIGFQPISMQKVNQTGDNSQLRGYEILTWDLLEFSVVGCPDNPSALISELGKGYSPETKRIITKGLKMDDDIGGDDDTSTDDKNAAGTDIQAIHCSKETFPKAEDASGWVDSNGYDSTKPHDSGDHWSFEQFPQDQLAEGSERTEDMADGVKATVGQKAPPDGAEAPEKKADLDKKDFTDDGTTTSFDGEEGQGGSDESPSLKQPVMQKAGHAYLKAIKAAADMHGPAQEHPEMVKLHDKVTKACGAAQAKAYPELAIDWSSDEDDGEDAGDDADISGDDTSDITSTDNDEDNEDEGDDEEVESRYHAATPRTKARMSKKAVKCIKEAAEHLDDMASMEEAPTDKSWKMCRRACMGHSGSLNGVVKDFTGDVTGADNGVRGDEGKSAAIGKNFDAEVVAKAAKALKDQFDEMRLDAYRITGKGKR